MVRIVALAALLIFLLQTINGSAVAAPSAYDLFKPPTHTFVRMSPDGQNLVFAYLETKNYCLDIYGRAIQGKDKLPRGKTGISRILQGRHI